jgi:sugar/nucleoside kinase (ribokinase family)
MILAIGEALVEFRRNDDDGILTTPGEWAGPFPSGAPAIFASVAARLGAPAALAAAVGDDQFGRALCTRLRQDGVLLDAFHVAKRRATALAFVAYDRSGGRDFWFSVHDSAAVAIDRAALERLWHEVDWLHVSGSTLGFGGAMADAVEATAQHLARSGGRISLDPNLRPDANAETHERVVRLARIANVLFPSAGELEGIGLDEQALLDGGAVICRTHGAGGATVQDGPEAARVHVSAPAVDEVDATGAGDTFAAAFVTAFRNGLDPITAARLACVTAARSVQVLGAIEARIDPAFATSLGLDADRRS